MGKGQPEPTPARPGLRQHFVTEFPILEYWAHQKVLARKATLG